jgi:hypothetical protein
MKQEICREPGFSMVRPRFILLFFVYPGRGLEKEGCDQ